MNTPPKVKLYTERTRAKDRTCKNRKGRNGRTQRSDVKWGLPRYYNRPNHLDRALNRAALDGIFTRSDVFLTVPQHDDHAHLDVAPEDMSRSQRRNRARKSKRNNRVKTIINTIFQGKGDR